MLRFHRGLSVLIVVALLVAVFGEALPIQAAPSLRALSAEQSPLESETASSHSSTPLHSAQSASLVMTSTLDAPTASGPSMYLNGASYVSIPNASLPAIGSGDFTLEAWVYPTNVTGFHAVMAKWYAAGFWFGIYNGKLRFYRGSTTFVETTAAIPINRWTHIAVNSYYDRVGQRLSRGVLHQRRSGRLSTFTPARLRSAARMICILAAIKASNTSSAILPRRASGTVALAAKALRRDMHHAINEKRTGLIANWHLTGDFKDAINGIDGTPVGSPAFVGFPSPAQPDVSKPIASSTPCRKPRMPQARPSCRG